MSATVIQDSTVIYNPKDKFHQIIQKHCPFFYIHPDDRYHPEAFESYLQKCELYHMTSATPVLEIGKINPQNLTSMTTNSHPSAVFDLSVPHQYSPYILYLDKEQREHVPDTSNNVGCDTKVNQQAPLYVFITHRDDRFTDVTYSMFTSYNASTACNGCLPIGVHDSDWERVVIRFIATPGSDETQHKYVHRIYLDQHGKGKWFDPRELRYKNGHPLIYCAWRSHAMYPNPGIKWRFAGFGNDYCKRSPKHLWEPKKLQIIDTFGLPVNKYIDSVPRWIFYTGYIGAQGMNLPLWRSDWNNTSNL